MGIYEAYQRHADLIVEALGLKEAKAVKTPGEDAKPWLEEEEEEPLDKRESTNYRAVAARANYLAMDRADIQYATKEICRGMSAPTRGDLRKLRRMGRYLVEKRRVVTRYD